MCFGIDARFCLVVISIALILDAYANMQLLAHHSDTAIISSYRFCSRSYTDNYCLQGIYVEQNIGSTLSGKILGINVFQNDQIIPKRHFSTPLIHTLV